MPVNFSAPAEAAPQRVAATPPISRETAVLRHVTPEAVKAAPSLEKAQKRAQELQQFKTDHGDPKEGLRRAGKVEPLSPTEKKQLEQINPTLAKEVSAFDTVTSVQAEIALGRDRVAVLKKPRIN